MKKKKTKTKKTGWLRERESVYNILKEKKKKFPVL
jgi:hypothetical protein